jgi:Nucleotidyl transferase AbiEii toxin, Type IV TA system
MDILDKEILALLKALATNEVQYIMVGGFALNLHGHHRTTGDMDIWIKDTVTNRKALRKTLADIEVGALEKIRQARDK